MFSDVTKLTLSGRQKKYCQIFTKISPVFFIDVHGVQIRWNFSEIFFRVEDREFYLVFDFFNSAQT